LPRLAQKPFFTGGFATAILLCLPLAASADTSGSGRSVEVSASVDSEFSGLLSAIVHDLTRIKAREREQIEGMGRGSLPRVANVPSAPNPLSRISIYSTPSALRIPVVGLNSRDLHDNFGDPREGGRRHRGIDIFAPRGAKVVAVTDGYISYLGEQPKGGRCLWLVNENGTSFYYAHLDRWAPGLYEGMEVTSGTLLGYVGTTGNAVKTPPHLHFQVVDAEETVDPYPLLCRSTVSVRRIAVTSNGHGAGK